jgi:hypothetical protein
MIACTRWLSGEYTYIYRNFRHRPTRGNHRWLDGMVRGLSQPGLDDGP